MNKYIAIAQIVIAENRQRRDFDLGELAELADSIEETGLMHPIVVREEGDALTLVAGERRLRAISDLYEFGKTFQYDNRPVPPGMIPFVTLGELTPLQAMQAEYEENRRRKDLTWQEDVQATALLVELRSCEAALVGKPAPTQTRIAAELKGENYSQTAVLEVGRDLILASRLDDDDIKGAKTANEAFKILKRKDEAQRSVRLGAALGPLVVAEKHQLHFGNCLNWMEGCAAETFDVILTDPPYGMGADEFGDSGGKAAGAHLYEDGAQTVRRLITHFPRLADRVTKPNAHLYLFCDLGWFINWKAGFEAAGWNVFRTPLIWYKPSAYRAPWPTQGPQRKYECILFAVKGSMKVTKLLGDVLQYQPDDSLGHQAQKPVALFVDLLKRSAVPGMRVLDPFCGSGPIFPAAQECKVFAIGVEEDETAYGIAAKRLQSLKESQ